MDFIRKSIATKASLVLIGMFLLFAIVTQVFVDLSPILPIAAFLLVTLGILIFGVHRPLQKIFQQMKAFLTARPYKKIFTSRIDEVGVLAHFFNDVTKNMERISVDIAESKRISQELSVGTDIQRRILPKTMPTVPGISLFGNMRPASEIGGDSYDVIVAPSGNTYVYVGDVTGHGLPAALIMMIVNTLIRTFAEIHGNGYDVIVNTNRILKQRIEPRRFMTCVLLRWNASEQKFYYTGAGHEHILIYRKANGTCEVRQTGGIALGMVPDVSRIVKEEAIPLAVGDSVVLYSDGIIEAKNMEGEMFGLARLKAAVEQYAGISKPEELFTNILKDFGIFVGEQIQADDITFIVLQRS